MSYRRSSSRLRARSVYAAFAVSAGCVVACLALPSAGLVSCISPFPSTTRGDASDGSSRVDAGVTVGSKDAGKDVKGEKADAGDAKGDGRETSDAPVADSSPMDAIAETSSAACTNTCTAGLTECAAGGGSVETCQTQSSGCTGWTVTTTCGSHETCSTTEGTATCTCDSTVCTQAGAQCESTTTLATCAKDTNNCLYVASTSPCTSPETCGGTAPDAACALTCSNSCSSGQTSCISGELATCTLQGNGCYAYGTPAGCPSSHQTCTGAAGSAVCACNTDPVCGTTLGNVCVSTADVATCSADSQGCIFESTSSMCGSNAPLCSGGMCISSCLIGGTLYASGVVDSANPCQSCQPSVNSTGWTLQPGANCQAAQACVAWYPDCDQDSFGASGATPVYSCSAPSGAPACAAGFKGTYVANTGDCCDTDSKAYPIEDKCASGATSCDGAGYYTVADACGSFDYNCDGTNEQMSNGPMDCVPSGLTCVLTGTTCTGNPPPAADCEGAYSNVGLAACGDTFDFSEETCSYAGVEEGCIVSGNGGPAGTQACR